MAITRNPNLDSYSPPLPRDFIDPLSYRNAEEEYRKYGRYSIHGSILDPRGMAPSREYEWLSEEAMRACNKALELEKKVVELEKSLADKTERIKVMAGEKAAALMEKDEADIAAMAFSVPTVEPSQTPEMLAAREEKCKAAINRTYDSMIKLKLWRW